MKFRTNKNGEKVRPHAIKLEVRFDKYFKWFKAKTDKSKTDVIRDSVEHYVKACGGDLKKIADTND